MAQTHQAVDVLTLLVHGVTAPDGELVGDATVDAGVDLLGQLGVVGHVDGDAVGQDEGHYYMIAQTRDALIAEAGVIGGAEEGFYPFQFIVRQTFLGAFGVEVDEHLVVALTTVVLALTALHAEADGHLWRGLLYIVGRLVVTLGQKVAIQERTFLQLLIAADEVGQLLKGNGLSVLAVEIAEILHNL